MYGLRKSWLAAQITRFTISGADSGAAAFPERRRARLPGTVGPDIGNVFALTDETIAAKITALNRIFGLKENTGSVSSVSYAINMGLAKKKMVLRRPLQGPRAILAAERSISYKSRSPN